jgi:hypothetical protein
MPFFGNRDQILTRNYLVRLDFEMIVIRLKIS